MAEAKRIRIELGPVSIQWLDEPAGLCPVCGGEVGCGPVGFSTADPVGPRCDGCLLDASQGLGMLLWMGHVAREVAGQAATAEHPLEADQCMVVLMAFAKVFHQGAEWPARKAAAMEFAKELSERLQQTPWAATINVVESPPS